MKRLHKLLTVRNVAILTGLFALVKGVWLYHDTNFFVYPPSIAWIENSRLIDTFISLSGVVLIVTAMLLPRFQGSSKFVIAYGLLKVLLIIIGVVALALATLGVVHGLFTSEFRMAHSALGDIYIFVIVYFALSDA